MLNPFQDTYETRLRSWSELRKFAQSTTLQQACVEIDRWWQQTPTVNHYLHWSDTENWPDPWTLLSENAYCLLTRALGMCYTLHMCGVNDIKLVTATDLQCEEHHLVLVDHSKYILNYWPDTVLSNSLQDFSVTRSIDLDSIKNKIK